MERCMSKGGTEAFNDAVNEWIDDDDDQDAEQAPDEGQEAEEGAAREAESDPEPEDADKAAEDLEKSGPEWARKRLSVIAKKRREAEERAEKAERDAEALAQQLRAAQRLSKGGNAKAERNPYDDDGDDDDMGDQKSSSEARLELLEQREAKRQYDAIVSETRAKYPSLPEWVIAGAIARGRDVDDVGTQWEADLAAAAGKTGAPTGDPAKPARKPITVAGKAAVGRAEPEKKKAKWEGRRKVDIRSLAKSVFDDIMSE
jgi:hypothetical protein